MRRRAGSKRDRFPRPGPGGWKTLEATERWLVLDTETTGLGEDREMVEVAVVGADGRLIFESLVRPSGRPSRDARRVHGLDSDMLRVAPDPGIVLPRLALLLQGRLVYGFGATFDRRTLELAYQRQGLRYPGCRWSCVLDRYIQVRGFSASLRTACEIETIRFPSGPHRAAVDAILAWQLLMKLRALTDS